MIVEILFFMVLGYIALKFIPLDRAQDIEKCVAPGTTTISNFNATFSYVRNYGRYKNKVRFCNYDDYDFNLNSIKHNIFEVFDQIDEETYNLFDIAYIEPVTNYYRIENRNIKITLIRNANSHNIVIYYENKNMRVTLTRDINSCNIVIYYENGNLMYEYNRSDNFTIVFNQYSSDGKISSSDTYDLYNFSTLLKHIPEEKSILNDISLIYAILKTYDLDRLIQVNNSRKIMVVSFEDKPEDELSEIEDELSEIFDFTLKEAEEVRKKEYRTPDEELHLTIIMIFLHLVITYVVSYIVDKF